jgi:hypothetical protein
MRYQIVDDPGVIVAIIVLGLYFVVVFCLHTNWQPKVKEPEEDKERKRNFPTATARKAKP